MSKLKTYDYTKEQLSAFQYAVIKTEKGDIVMSMANSRELVGKVAYI